MASFLFSILFCYHAELKKLGNSAELQMHIYAQLDQQHPTLNNMDKYTKQSTLIDYRCYDIIKLQNQRISIVEGLLHNV